MKIEKIIDKFGSMHDKMEQMIFDYVKEHVEISLDCDLNDTTYVTKIYYENGLVMLDYSDGADNYCDELYIFTMDEYYKILLAIANEDI